MTDKQAAELLRAIHEVLEWASMRGPVGNDWRKFARLERAVPPLTRQVRIASAGHGTPRQQEEQQKPMGKPLIDILK